MPKPSVVMTTETAPITPPSAPFLHNAPADAPDDIPDPPVPESLAAEAMAQPVPGLRAELEQALEGAGLRPTTAVVPSGGTTPPAVPATVPALPEALLPLAHGFCAYLQARMHDWMMTEHRELTKGMDVTMSGIRDYATKVLQCNEHAEYQLADALQKLREDGLKLVETPYTLQVQVRNPAGVPIVITVRKATAAELLDELTRLEGWLASQGYTGAQEVAF